MLFSGGPAELVAEAISTDMLSGVYRGCALPSNATPAAPARRDMGHSRSFECSSGGAMLAAAGLWWLPGGCRAAGAQWRGNKIRRPGFSRSLRFRPLSGGSLPLQVAVRPSSHRAQMAVTSGASRVGTPHSPRPCAPHVRHVCASPRPSTACWRPPPCAVRSL